SGVSDGAVCGTGKVCSAHTCILDCTASGVTAGTSCDTGKVCSAAAGTGSGTCAAGCFIGGSVYSPGFNPGDACQLCDPDFATTSWITGHFDGFSCDTGKECHAGTCVDICSVEVDGTSCDTGKVCSPSHTCVDGCF